MTGATRFYGSLLRLYPRRYRQAFGAQMMQTFVDWHDDVAGADGRVGVAVWLPMIADEARNIAGQQLESLAASGRPAARGAMLALAVLIVLVTGIGGRDDAVERAAATGVAGEEGTTHRRAAHDPTMRTAGSVPPRSEFARRITSPSLPPRASLAPDSVGPSR